MTKQQEEDALWDAENWPGLVSFFSREIDAARAKDVKKPRYSYCLFQRGAAYLSMDPPNYALAKRDVKTTLDLDPDCPNAHTSMADILLHEDTTASCQQAVVHATKALASRHPLGEWKKGSVRFLALQVRADARFELLDEKKLGYSDELSDLAEQDLKTLVDKNSKWKDYEPDDEAITDLEEKLADVRAEAKRRSSGGRGGKKGKKRSAPSPPTDKQQQPDASKPPDKRVGRDAEEEAEIQAKLTRIVKEEDVPKKRGPGRPKKEEGITVLDVQVPIKRKPGRPKKSADITMPLDVEDVVVVKKKGPGRPKKADKEKFEHADEKKAKKEKSSKKYEMMNVDHESDIATGDDEDDRDYPRCWTREDVAEWLPSIGAAYRQYKTVFVDNGVDGKVLLGIIGGDNEERANVEMEETLKVKSAIHRAALISAARKLRGEAE